MVIIFVINITTFSLIYQTCFEGTSVILVLHILKSPLNLNRARCYKVRYIALAILRTEKFKISDDQLLTGRESGLCVSPAG